LEPGIIVVHDTFFRRWVIACPGKTNYADIITIGGKNIRGYQKPVTLFVTVPVMSTLLKYCMKIEEFENIIFEYL